MSWHPLPGPQTQAYECTADELFYGGAAGGGKTDLLLGLASTAHHSSIIFRRVFPELRGMIERSRELFARDESHAKDSYNESLHIWRFSSGRMIEFGALQYEKDRESYRGRPHDLYAWDEVTEIPESSFRFVNAWNRTTRRGQRCRIVATFNPPTTAEGQWVVDYLAPWLDAQHQNPAVPGELRWFATVDGKDVERPNSESFEHTDATGKTETIKPRSRTFIPARLEDNPILEASGYRAVLQGLPEPLRSQMLYGDFTAGTIDDAWQVIPTAWIDAAMARWKDERPDVPLSALGVDVARGGNDKTTLTPRYGAWFGRTAKYPGTSTPDGPAVAALVKTALGSSGAPANIDVIGVGASAYDAAKANGINAVALNGSEASTARDRTKQLTFRNRRAEWHWKMRELLDPQYGENIALPPDRELRVDLCAPRWKLTVTGIQVEDKEEIKKRINRSPDVGESVIYASAIVRTRGIGIG